MSEIIRPESAEPLCSARTSSRRTFLKLSGAAVALLGIAPGASAATEYFPLPIGSDDDKVVADLGSGDTGILNYAYALEQLEAAFYTEVISNPYSAMPPNEKQMLMDIRDHEIVHRDFFKAALGAHAIPALTPNFKKVKFKDRMSVLTTAQTFEDLGVDAYNGAGQLLTNPDYLLLAGKIVSVEARHAAAIRDLLKPRTGNFAPDALDGDKKPADVLKAAGPFIKTKINPSGLPTEPASKTKGAM